MRTEDMTNTTKKLDAVAGAEVLNNTRNKKGLFSQVLGLSTGTTRLTAVHIMNDLAQSVIGGAPSHRGDILSRIVREDREKEDNSHAALRREGDMGERFSHAYPPNLGDPKITQLRRAAGLLLNADGRIYRAGDQMNSGVATHWTMLGFEGFRRFGVGRYIAHLLGEEGRERVRELYLEQDQDPVTRALAPLKFEAPLEDTHPEPVTPTLSEFDEAFSRGLQRLLEHQLSKPTLMRFLALGACLGVALKPFGLGREGGRPTLLALPADDRDKVKALRQPAVQSLNRAVDAMDRAFARTLIKSTEWQELWRAEVHEPWPTVEVVGEVGDLDAAAEFLRVMRAHKSNSMKSVVKESAIYWPDAFAIALGKEIGAIAPKKNSAGWGKHLALTPDLVEVLTLMFVSPGEKRSWAKLWGTIRDELGILIGADEYLDSAALKAAGVPRVSLHDLAHNNDIFLNYALRRGIARRLPDKGAEAGGELL